MVLSGKCLGWVLNVSVRNVRLCVHVCVCVCVCVCMCVCV